MRKAAVLALVLAAGCASQDSAPPPAPRAVPDPSLAQLQVSMTELLERIDVLNHRIARLEEARTETATAASARPAATAPVVRSPEPQRSMSDARRPVEPQRTAQSPRPAPQQPASPGADPMQPALVAARIAEEYREGIMLFGRGNHAEARRRFEGAFEADPTGDLADNALFWIGETYFAAGEYSNAIRFYNRVVNDYSDQNKAPDALYKTAVVQIRTGDLALARRTLQQVIERYPYSSTAATAKAELQRIRY